MTPGPTRDTSRSQVYAAEDLSAELTSLVQSLPIAELADVARRLCDSAWWSQNVGGEPVRVAVNRSERRSYYDVGSQLISLSPAARDLNTLCHELAHAACAALGDEGASHGPFFRAVHVQVRHAVTGITSGQDLALVYGQFGLSLSQNGLVPPVPTQSVLPESRYRAERVVGRPGPFGVSADSGPIAL